MWVERLIKHFLSYFSRCPAPQWTLLFPSPQVIPPCTVLWVYTQNCKCYHISFFRMLLVWDTIIQLLRKNQLISLQQGQSSTLHHRLSLKISSESHTQKKQIWLFSIITSSSITFSWLFPHSEHNSYSYIWFNYVNLHLRWSFCTHQYSRLITEWPLRASQSLHCLSQLCSKNKLKEIDFKMRMSLFSDFDRLERSPCSRILICIPNFHPDWIWLNTFIQSQYFATI